jgi:ankyrin repeat protein
MGINLHALVRTAMLAVALAVACAGCVLFSPPAGTYRSIHAYAAAGNVAAVAQDLATNSSDLNLPDEAGRTPLHLAATHCQTGVAQLLLDQGAKVNAKATGGTTPLHLAAQAGCAEVVSLLLVKGAKVNARDDQGRTPLDRAQQWQQTNIVILLQAHQGRQ